MALENEGRLPQRYRAKRPHHPLRSIHSQVFDQTPRYHQAHLLQHASSGSEQSYMSRTTGDLSILSKLTSLRSSVSSPYTPSSVPTLTYPYYCPNISTTSIASPNADVVSLKPRGHTYEARTHNRSKTFEPRDRRHSYMPSGPKSKTPITPINAALLTPENPYTKRHFKEAAAPTQRVSQGFIAQARNVPQQPVRPPLRKLPAIDDRSTLPSQQRRSTMSLSDGTSRITSRKSSTHCEGLRKDGAGQEISCRFTQRSLSSVETERQAAAMKVTGPDSPSQKHGHHRSRTTRDGTETDMTTFAELKSRPGIPTEYNSTSAEKEPGQKGPYHETKVSSMNQSQNRRDHLSMSLQESQLFNRRRARSLSLIPTPVLDAEAGLQYVSDALNAPYGTSAADIKSEAIANANNGKRMVHFRSYASIHTVETSHYRSDSDSSSISIDLEKADLLASGGSERAVMTGAVEESVVGVKPRLTTPPDGEKLTNSGCASDAKVEEPSDTELEEALQLARSRSTQFSPNEEAKNVRASQSYLDNVKMKRGRRTEDIASRHGLRRSQFTEMLNDHWTKSPADLVDFSDQPTEELSDEAVGALDRAFAFPAREADDQRPSTPNPYSSRPLITALPLSQSTPVLGAKHSHKRDKASLGSIKSFFSIRRESKQDRGFRAKDKGVARAGTLHSRARSVSKKMGGIWRQVVGQGERKVD